MDETCFRCGAEGWVNSLGYCKDCMQEMIDQHHEEAELETMALEAKYGYNARV
jgi:hypothetical protein